MTKSETSPFCTEWIGFVVIFWHRHSEFEVLSFFGFMFEFKLFEFNCEDCVNNMLLSRTKWYKILYKRSSSSQSKYFCASTQRYKCNLHA